MTTKSILQAMAADPAEYRRQLLIPTPTGPKPLAEVQADFQREDFEALDPALINLMGKPYGDRPLYRRAWIERTKSASKDHDSAITGLYLLCFSPRRMTLQAAAVDRQQAQLIQSAAQDVIDANRWMQNLIDVSLYKLTNKHTGSTLEILSHDTRGSHGARPSAVFVNELSHFADREFYDVLFANVAKNPAALLVVLTNAGTIGHFAAELRELARQSDRWYFSTFTGQAPWLSREDIEEQLRSLPRGMAQRLWFGQWTAITDNPLLSMNAITEAYSPGCLWRNGIAPTGYRPHRLYVGFDIGRTRDLSVISVIELTEDHRAIIRDLHCMQGVTFANQEAEFCRRVEQRGVLAARIDRGAIGLQLAERMEERYGRRVRGVSMGQNWQGQAALKLARLFQERRIAIPRDAILANDLQQVEEVGTSKAGVPVLKTERTEFGHADRFWSLALAVDAMPTLERRTPRSPSPRGFGASVGHRTAQPRSVGLRGYGGMRSQNVSQAIPQFPAGSYSAKAMKLITDGMGGNRES